MAFRKKQPKRSKIGEWYCNLRDSADAVLRETKIEIKIGLGAGILAGALISGHYEAQRTKMIPLGFSEISQIEQDAKASGDSIGSVTRYLASTNDMVMKVFESHNNSYKQWGADSKMAFARELEIHSDPALNSHHYSLDNLLEKLPELAKNASNKMTNFIDARNKIMVVNEHFNATWQDYHHDNFHTEIDISTDADGNTVMNSVDEYDSTDHHYKYNKTEGELSSASLNALIESHPKFLLKEEIKRTRKTNAEGEYASDISRILSKGKLRLERLELLDIANTWNDCSTIKANLPNIYSAWENLQSSNKEWKTAKTTAKDSSYYTRLHWDAGPKEFQIAENAIRQGEILESNISEIISSIQYTSASSQTLRQKVHEYISVVLDNKQGNAEKLRSEIMGISKNIYKRNFNRGFDVDRVRGYIIMLGMILGGAIGNMAGIGVDALGNIRYRRKKRD